MIKSKLLRTAISSLAAINIISFAACSKKTTTSTSDVTTIYGKVTKVDGKSITITVGTWKGGQGGDNQGTPPGSSGSNSINQGTSSGSNPPASPSNNNGSNSGTQGAQQGTPPDMLTLTNETKTITLSDTSIIKKQSMAAPGSSNSNTSSASSTASLSDITVESILKLTYTSGKLSSVEIVGGMNGGSTPAGTGGGSGSPTITGTGAYTKSGTASDQKISADSSNQSGIRISDGKTLIITGSTITKSGKTTSAKKVIRINKIAQEIYFIIEVDFFIVVILFLYKI